MLNTVKFTSNSWSKTSPLIINESYDKLKEEVDEKDSYKQVASSVEACSLKLMASESKQPNIGAGKDWDVDKT